MPTNDQQSGATGPAPGPIADLAARRRARLQDLLRRRSRLAAVVAERVAHDLSDSDDFIIELLGVEQAIESHWPAVYEELAFTEWLFADMALMHTPDEPLSSCGICTALSTGAPPPDRPAAPAARPVRDQAA